MLYATVPTSEAYFMVTIQGRHERDIFLQVVKNMRLSHPVSITGVSLGSHWGLRMLSMRTQDRKQ
jgi:hypothetical protein